MKRSIWVQMAFSQAYVLFWQSIRCIIVLTMRRPVWGVFLLGGTESDIRPWGSLVFWCTVCYHHNELCADPLIWSSYSGVGTNIAFSLLLPWGVERGIGFWVRGKLQMAQPSSMCGLSTRIWHHYDQYKLLCLSVIAHECLWLAGCSGHLNQIRLSQGPASERTASASAQATAKLDMDSRICWMPRKRTQNWWSSSASRELRHWLHES